MSALLDKPQTGYELTRSIDTSLGFFWHASHQQVYAELKKLEAKQWLQGESIQQQSKPNKIVYRLSDQGRAALDQWVLKEDGKQRTTKDELLVRLYNLTDENAPHLAKQIRIRLTKTELNLQLYEKIKRNYYQNPETLDTRKTGIYLALMNGIEDAKLTKVWCYKALDLLAAKGLIEQESTINPQT